MIRNDCIYFKGEKPCQFKLTCEKCPHFKPFQDKILIIKCRAMGDVLRTTALLPGLKRKYPQSFISWLVDEESLGLLLHNPYIDRVVPNHFENILPLLVEKFDILICLDKESGLTSLATKVQASQKFGFGLNEHGNLMAFNPASAYAYALGINDEMKFYQNKKTYQEMIYEIAEIEYQNERYVFELKEQYSKKAEAFFTKHKIDKRRPAIGLNTGAGTKFDTKLWPKEHFLKLIDLLSTRLRAQVFLLGSQKEKMIHNEIKKKSRYKVYDVGCDNSLLEFAGFVSLLDLILSSDSLGMHLALALGKKVIALFGPTCPQEISLYGQGTKIFAGTPCAPCYKPTCPDGTCMREILPERVFQEIQRII